MKIQLCLPALAACLLWAAISPPSNAAAITYQLSGASATFTSPSATVSLTGDFTFDPSGPALDSIDITATETSGSGVLTNTTVEFTTPELGFPTVIEAFDPVTSDLISISFASGLGSAAADINDVRFETPSAGVNIATSVAGSVIAVAEPSTWAMMLVGFGLLGGASYWTRRRHHREHERAKHFRAA
jgi:hypothetical protein